MPLAGLTALQALLDIARLAGGQRLLVHGASGGVGSLAVQIARDLGAHVVAVASQQHADWLRELGAHECVDYRLIPLASLTPRFDVVFDVHGGIGAEVRRHILTPKGRYVSIVPSWTGFARQALDRLWPGPSVRYLFVKPSGAELQHLAEKIVAGVLRSTLTPTFDFSEAVAAVRMIASGHTRGKLVLRWS